VAGALVAAPLGDVSIVGTVLVASGVIFLVGLVNAFNFMDGIDGISAVTVVVAGGWFMWLGRDADVTTGAAGVMVGSALGFLYWNAAGRVFLGDVGSYFLGGLLAVLIIRGVEDGVAAHLMVAPVAVYVGDTVGTLIRRVRQGHQVGVAHRDHVYQRLTQAGLSHLRVALLVGAWQALVCVSTWLLRDSLVLVLLSWAALLTAYALLPGMVRTRVKEVA
jgi:UDP-N-acetylmuramyl pentapeptide phosphotransferase/UDP-N-acetylglucosamine-1-phosphate transferase